MGIGYGIALIIGGVVALPITWSVALESHQQTRSANPEVAWMLLLFPLVPILAGFWSIRTGINHAIKPRSQRVRRRRPRM